MFRYFKEKKFDVICVQETHACSNVQKLWASEWGGRMFLANGETNSRGVGILFKRKLDIKIKYINKHSGGRFLILDLEITKHRYTLASIYGPNKDDQSFYIEFFPKFGLPWKCQ